MIRDTPVAVTAITADIFVIGRPLDAPLGDAAYAITTLQPREGGLENSLRGVAGLTQFRRTDARSANATSQGATLRGLGGNASSRALLLLDGVPQTDPFGGWVTWPAFAPERLSAVRVTRGGGSGSAGPGALAGTIEMESIGAFDTQGLTAAAAYGSRNSVEANALLAGRLGEGHGFIDLDYARGDGFVPIIARQRGSADIAAPYEQISLAARGVAPLGGGTQLQASFLAFTDRRTRGTILSGNGGDGADASVRLVHRGRWQWQGLAYLQMRKFQSRFVAVDATRATVTQTVDQYNVPSTGIGARFEVRPPLGDDVELRIGGDWRRTSGETNEFFTYVAAKPTRLREAGGVNATLGAFAEASVRPGTDLTLTGGARIDRWTISNGRLIERTIATGALLRNEIAPDRSGWEPTGRAGIAWERGQVTLRSAAYLGWRLPTLNELYRPFRVGADATAANPALAPERMRGIEAGLRWAWTGATGHHGDVLYQPPRVSFSATLFTNRLTKPIANVTLGSGPGTFPGVGFVAVGGAYRQRLNVDAITSTGVELDASASSGDWRVDASAAFTNARVRSTGLALALDGLRPAQVPKLTSSVTLGWRRVSVTARYVSAQFEDDGNSRRLADALTFDASAEIPVASRLTLTLRGENLANARVEAAISGAGLIERATPRTLWLGVRYGGR